MELNDKYSIENEAHGFSLVEKTTIEETKDGKKTGKIKEGSKKFYYGTVYQALQAFLKMSVNEANDIDEVLIKVNRAVSAIEEAGIGIEKRFRCEVLKC